MAKIAIIAASQGLGLLFKHLVDVGVNNLESLGHEVVLYPTVLMSYEDVESNYQIRANDFNAAFSDDLVDVIISLIGGNDSINIIPYIEVNKIKNKKVIGFSDATSYLSFLAEYGADCIYGPSLLAGIVQLDNLGSKYKKLVTNVLDGEQTICLPIYDCYGFKYHDWKDVENNGRIENMYPSNGPLNVQGEG
jgi:muramoyltetrapeptide carboxypeptidase LdcA involved in peptidoglycan recycling